MIKRLVYFCIRKMFEIKNPTLILKPKTRISSTSSFGGKNAVGVGTGFNGELGFGSYIGPNCNISGKIGKYTCIGSNVSTISSTHPLNGFVSINPMFFSTQKQNGYTYVTENRFQEMIYADEQMHSVIVGSDVWIGSNVIILGGVKIGDGAVIAAGAVVTKDVESYSIVGGVPAKHIKYRFNEADRDFLNSLQWWDRKESWISANAEFFSSVDELKSILEEK